MPSSVDIVLVSPGNQRQIYQSLSKYVTAKEPPVWAGLLGTYIRKSGYSVQIIDSDAEELSPAETVGRILTLNPMLVALVIYGHQPSASTQVMPGASAICNELKQTAPEIPVIMLGGHVAALPERTIRDERTDFVCSGEGPHTLLKLLDVLKRGAKSYEDVPDLWYRVGGEVQFTLGGSLIDFDASIPEGLAWDLLPMERYRAHDWHCLGFLDKRQPYASTYTTLGCSFKCTFCCINSPFGGPNYRMRSPEHVVEEIDLLVQKFHVRNFKFADEMFVLNRKHVEEICDRLIARGYDLNIWAYARVDTVRSEGLLEKMRKAGFTWLALGIESGNDRVRNSVNKSFAQQLIHDSIDRLRKADISVVGNYIFGLPEDDLDSMKATLGLALELNTEWANFYSCMAYPGSQLYLDAIREGLPLPASWSGYSQHSYDTFPLPTKYLSSGQVLAFRDYAFLTYMTNPRYLELLRSKFGQATVDHIKEVTQVKLERKYATPVA